MIRCHIQNLAMLSAVLTFAGCHSSNENSSQHVEGQAESAASGTTSSTSEHFQKTVEGTVLNTQDGKDGYTAKIEMQDGSTATITVSRVNLNDPKQYRRFNAHEIVTVKGEFWKMGADPQITVREIL